MITHQIKCVAHVLITHISFNIFIFPMMWFLFLTHYKMKCKTIWSSMKYELRLWNIYIQSKIKSKLITNYFIIESIMKFYLLCNISRLAATHWPNQFNLIFDLFFNFNYHIFSSIDFNKIGNSYHIIIFDQLLHARIAQWLCQPMSGNAQ